MIRRWLCAVAVGLTVCQTAAAEEPNPAQAAKDRAVVETLLRLKGMDVNASPAWRGAALRYLETLRGTAKFVDLAEKLKLRGVEDELFRLALEDATGNVGAQAAAALVRRGEVARFLRAAEGLDESLAVKAVAVLGTTESPEVVDALQPLAVDAHRAMPVRVAAASAIGRHRRGQRVLLEMARSNQLPEELKFTVANILLSSTDDAIRSTASGFLSLPATASSQPLPPLAELMKLPGNPQRGRQIFQTTGTCAKCHKIRGEGKDVGPDLSEIGSKLSKEAFFVAILDPSAGISHNYETYVAATTSGSVVTGLLISRTDQTLTLRTAEGIDRELPAAGVEELQKSRTSLMPADLQKLLSVQDLVDLVAFLGTLTKAG